MVKITDYEVIVPEFEIYTKEAVSSVYVVPIKE